jgi:hypothetical protein
MLLIGVLAATLIGCSRQPPPQAAMPGKATLAWQSKKPVPGHARYAARLTGKAAKSTTVAAKTDAASRIPLPPRLSHVQAAGMAAADRGRGRTRSATERRSNHGDQSGGQWRGAGRSLGFGLCGRGGELS